jgi:maleate isomerase
MADRVLLGMLTPSSNTILEPVTSAILADLPDVSAHFGRLRVTEISMSESAVDQFKDKPFLEAASLLADARVDCMAWNGTAAGWLGFENDRKLCRAIEAETGVPATTTVLAKNEIFERTGIKRYALVTPYLDEIQERIIENYAGAGYSCVAERHLRDRGNFSFSQVPDRDVAELIRAVAAEKPEAISVFCTNLQGATVVDELERELGIPIYDSVALTAWKCLSMAGVDTTRVSGWGRLFSDLA